MAAAEIQVVNQSNLAKIESFLNDPSYKEIIENSSTFNSRLCAERRMRMPFIDTQTGVAQSHSNLFMTRKQRMPGAREGQVYTYPSQRWRKTRRQYLTMSSTRWGWNTSDAAENTGDGENSSGLPDGLVGDESRDGSQSAVKDDPKEWFYDELAMEEMETGEEPDPESDEDYYDDTYANRRRRRGGATPTGPGSRGGRTRKSLPDDTPVKRGRAGRGRKRAGAASLLPYEVAGDAEKPFGCELCGAKYKTRAGLIYHFNHTHKDGAAASTTPTAAGSDNDSRDSRAAHSPPAPPQPATEYQDSYVTFLNNPAVGAAAPAQQAPPPPVRRPSPPPRPASADTSSSDSAHAPLVAPGTAAAAAAPASPAAPPAAPAASAAPELMKEPDTKASPSPYCDFCLGDDRENKKTGTPEELVSCSDCGRSGKRRGRPPRNGVRKCYHVANRVCERHRHLRDNVKLNGVVEILTSMSYPADDFDSFASKTKLLENCEYATSPPSSRQSPACEELARVNGSNISGHPTCLQFTANMIVSVRKYRWQCIECKCCSVCGTSDNDDQLLFCDDCDRGYHMYCLAPPLDTPPEGSWSCALCIKEFH